MKQDIRCEHCNGSPAMGTKDACQWCEGRGRRDARRCRRASKHFRVVAKGESFRLTHIPSGDFVQQDLRDFSTRKAAIECRDRMLAAAPDWDWSHPGLFAEMPTVLFHKVWKASYAVVAR